MGDQVDGAGFAVVDDVHHFVLHRLAGLGVAGGVDGFCAADAGQVQALMRPQAVELDPGVHPGVGRVGAVGGHLPRHHQEPMARGDGVFLAVGHQLAPSFNNIVEQIMVAGVGPVRVGGGSAFPAKLIEVQVNEAFIAEYMEFQLFRAFFFLCHMLAPPCRRGDVGPAGTCLNRSCLPKAIIPDRQEQIYHNASTLFIFGRLS